MTTPTHQDHAGKTETRRLAGVRWWILSFLTAFMFLNYADRAALSVGAPQIRADLGIDLASFGVILSIFYVGYAPFAFLGGWAGDRWGIRRVYAIAAAWWSMFTVLTAAGATFLLMCIIRTLFGAGEGPAGTLTAKTVNGWFPQREYGRAFSLTVAAQPLGGAIAVPIVVEVTTWAGGDWRAAFIVLGALGLLVASGWFALARDLPEQHPWVSRSELVRITDGPLGRTPLTTEEPRETAKLRSYFKEPAILGIAASFFAYAWVLYVLLAWLPTYLLDARRIDFSQLSWAGSLPWIAGVLGSLASGIIADVLIRRTGATVAVRKWLLIGGLAIGSVGIAVVAFAGSLVFAVLVFALVLFALYICGAQFFPLLSAILPAARYGGVAGGLHGFANIAGVAAPVTTGFLVDSLDSWTLAFGLAGAVGIIGAAATSVVGRRGRPVAATTEATQ